MHTEQLIQNYINAFNQNNMEAQLATLHEQVVHDLNEGGSEIGRDAFRKFKSHMNECYREQLVDVVIMTNGNRGAAEFMVEGTYIKTDGNLPPAHGQRYRVPAAAFFETDGALITRVTSYYNLKGWIAAVS